MICGKGVLVGVGVGFVVIGVWVGIIIIGYGNYL